MKFSDVFHNVIFSYINQSNFIHQSKLYSKILLSKIYVDYLQSTTH